MVASLLNTCGNIIFHGTSSKTVLIHADHKRRDAAASLLLGYYLQSMGYNTVIGSRISSRALYHLFKPEAVLMTHPDAFLTPDELKEGSKNCSFILMHPESSGMIREGMLEHMRGGKEEIGLAYAQHYSQVLTWGPVLKNWIVEAGLYPEENVKMVGCTRYDFYRDAKRFTTQKRTLGGMPSFTGISMFHNPNMFEHLDLGRGAHGIYYGRDGGYEDFLWAAAAYVRLFLEFLDIWCLELKNPVAFRPYTLECLDDYIHFSKKYGELFTIDTKSPFPGWLLQRSASVFCYSSSIIESIISGVPYITLQEVLGDRLEYHMPSVELPDVRGEIYRYTYQPGSIHEVVELAQKATKGNLPLKTSYKESEPLQKLLWDYYGWPQKCPSCWIVAKEIDGLMQETRKDNTMPRLKGLTEVAKTCARVLAARSGGDWHNFDDYHFLPWHLREKAYARKEYERLKKSGEGHET
ncbi:MAG: surface carbohydrate biosynthesis protein [Deltaproteobacteria bacterium]|nr:surface carbohydrate biosynthesis protein [Deltaproteobacteria bacterium]